MEDNLLDLQNSNCQLCPVNELRTNVVNGIGPLDSKILFVCDFPSLDEDSSGIPLKGISSQKLSNILNKLGLHISQVRVTYAVRCRPNLKTVDGFRQPNYEEVESCLSYLETEINKIKPNIIVPLGVGAVSAVLQIKKPKIKELRGLELWSDKYKCKVLPTLAIGAILRSPNQEEVVSQDIRRAIESSKYSELTPSSKGNYITIETIEEFDEFYTRILEQEEVAVDLETSGFDWQKDKIIGCSFSWKVGTGVFLPITKWVGVEHQKIVLKDKKVRRKGQIEIKQVEEIEKWIEDTYQPWWIDKQDYVMSKFKVIMESDIKWTAQNGKFDYKFFLQMGWNPKPLAYDTMLMHYLLCETDKGGHNLEDMSLQYLGRGQHKKELDDWFKANKMEDDSKKNYARVPTDLLFSYGAADADVTFELKQIFLSRLEQEGMLDVFYKLIMPLNHTLTITEFEGFKIDRIALNKAKQEMQQEMAQLEQELKAMVGDINVNSSQQLADVLFNTLKLPILKTTPKGAPCTDEETMNLLANRHPVPMKIVEYRGLAKLLSTYILGIEERLDDNGRLHTKFHIPGTDTGRLSSSDPNLQNIPVKDKRVKNTFIVEDGNILTETDMAQNEFRWWGILSNDPQLVKDLNDGVDIHKFIAALANKISIEQVTKEQRQAAKSIVFGTMFSMGADKLAKDHKVTVEYAKHVQDTFFSRYPVAKQWRYNIVKQAKRDGFVKSRFGRVRHLPGINSMDNKVGYSDEQSAINMPIQGAASDYVSNAANRIVIRFEELGLHGKLRNLVHDAVYMEISRVELEQSLQIINEEMTRQILGIQVPLVTEHKIGKRWGRMHKIKVDNNIQKHVAN